MNTKTRLIQAAFDAAKQSYSPYSEYRVGAAVLTASGQIYSGCNIENSSYPAGLCAERTAAASAIAKGERSFDAIAIVGYKAQLGPEQADWAYPCGVCRQFLNEFVTTKTKVYVARGPEDVLELTWQELLPYSFGPERLLED